MNTLCKAIVAFSVISAFAANASGAEDMAAPTVGLLYNHSENSSLSFECARTSESAIHCKFVQTFVRRQKPPAAVVSDEEVKSEIASLGKEGDLEKCKSDVAEIESGISHYERNPAEARDGRELKDWQIKRSDALKGIALLRAFCEQPSKAALLEVSRQSSDISARTCRVGSSSFEQDFSLVSDPQSGNFAWVVSGSPSGPCGVIQLSRFESETGSFKGFWRYIAKKEITNPDGTFIGKSKCSDLDSGTYVYDIRDSNRPLKCDYIDFSLF